jgi:hypothetical protein
MQHMCYRKGSPNNSYYGVKQLPILKILKRRKECDIYLTHICRHHSSRDSLVKRWKCKELSANTVAFIIFKRRLTKVLAGAARRKQGEGYAVSNWQWLWLTKSTSNLKRHINLYFNPMSLLVSTFDNLTWPPLPLLPFYPLAAPANTLVSPGLQLMKATVLAESSVYFHPFTRLSLLLWCL